MLVRNVIEVGYNRVSNALVGVAAADVANGAAGEVHGGEK